MSAPRAIPLLLLAALLPIAACGDDAEPATAGSASPPAFRALAADEATFLRDFRAADPKVLGSERDELSWWGDQPVDPAAYAAWREHLDLLRARPIDTMRLELWPRSAEPVVEVDQRRYRLVDRPTHRLVVNVDGGEQRILGLARRDGGLRILAPTRAGPDLGRRE